MKLELNEILFLKFFNINKIDIKNKSFLCAVSGGVDSMVLNDLLNKSKLNFSVASCNYKLRKESDQEIEMIRSICKKNNIKFYSKIIKSPTKNNGNSFQMIAREKRYKWFNELMSDNKYDYLLTAHHADDNVETILLNLTRTTGLRGFIGIPESKNKILRPLISFGKDEILSYAKNNRLDWSEDSSNLSEIYFRNKIRRNVIPILKEINPSLNNSISSSLKRLRLVDKLLEINLSDFERDFVSYEDEFIVIDNSFFNNSSQKMILFYEFLNKYGFSFSQIEKFIPLLKETNKKLISATHELISDRNTLIIKPYNYNFKLNIITNKVRDVDIDNYTIKSHIYKKGKLFISKSKENAQLDYDKIKFPITYRNYKLGDSFYPLGMNKKKKVSSYISDVKMSYISKFRQIVIEDSNNQIIWLVGQQINDRFKINSNTKNIINFEII
jgi:tRNA(Ile)-lysidine synthase|tara:strand:+ start:180 stop:1505 length:1326 start_codon:yes stop_codon:yes gene_type:complete